MGSWRLLAKLRRPPGRLLIAQIVAELRRTDECPDEDPVARDVAEMIARSRCESPSAASPHRVAGARIAPLVLMRSVPARWPVSLASCGRGA